MTPVDLVELAMAESGNAGRIAVRSIPGRIALLAFGGEAGSLTFGFLEVDGKSCAIAFAARQVAIQPIDNHTTTGDLCDRNPQPIGIGLCKLQRLLGTINSVS